MNEMGKEWVGRSVDGRFPLLDYLGGSDRTAVFLSRSQASGGSGDAAIKLIACDETSAEKQLLRWEEATELNHPNLIRIFEGGRCKLDDKDLIYVVEEYAEENLSQVLPERALTAEETREVLPPVLRALQFLHDNGFVHGRIHPSNILAIENQVKLSSDALGVPGEWDAGSAASAYDPPEAATGAVTTASDIWQLGMMLSEVLTQRLPVWDAEQGARLEVHGSSPLPQPFKDIIENCLRIEPASRWSLAQITERLEGRQPAGTPSRRAAVPASVATAAAAKPAVAKTAVAKSAVAETAIVANAAAVPTLASLPSAEDGKRPAKLLYITALIAAAAIAIFLIARPKSLQPPSTESPTQGQQNSGGRNSQPAQTSQAQPSQAQSSAQRESKPSLAATATRNDNKSVTAGADDVLHREIPQVSPGARRTVRGKIKVRVKVTADANGDVTKARIESGGPSKYFSRIALQAAKGWKFTPAQSGDGDAARQWNLQFVFSRTDTDASAMRTKR